MSVFVKDPVCFKPAIGRTVGIEIRPRTGLYSDRIRIFEIHLERPSRDVAPSQSDWLVYGNKHARGHPAMNTDEHDKANENQNDADPHLN